MVQTYTKKIVLFANDWQKRVGGNLHPRDDQHRILKQSLNLGTAQLQSIYLKCKSRNRKSNIYQTYSMFQNQFRKKISLYFRFFI